jgi:hypothetical protein
VSGRFGILLDEHWSKGHFKALRGAGWDVVRSVDVAELGQGKLDPEILAYCAKHGRIWITADLRARAHIAKWIESGGTLPGVVIAVQRKRVEPGRLVRFLEGLAAETTPFAGVVCFVAPEV